MRETVSRLETTRSSRPIPSGDFPVLGADPSSDWGLPGCNRRYAVALPFRSLRRCAKRDSGQGGFPVSTNPHALQLPHRQRERHRVPRGPNGATPAHQSAARVWCLVPDRFGTAGPSRPCKKPCHRGMRQRNGRTPML